MQKSSETIQAGDILFYRAATGNLLELLIQKFERKASVFVHCAIAIGSDQKIEALPDGVVQSQIARTPDGIFHYQQSACKLDTRLFNDALEWPRKQVGQAHSLIDIADAVLSAHEHTIPPWYDCSALATKFLIEAGGVDLGSLSENVHAATPQELANQLNVK